MTKPTKWPVLRLAWAFTKLDSENNFCLLFPILFHLSLQFLSKISQELLRLRFRNLVQMLGMTSCILCKREFVHVSFPANKIAVTDFLAPVRASVSCYTPCE